MKVTPSLNTPSPRDSQALDRGIFMELQLLVPQCSKVQSALFLDMSKGILKKHVFLINYFYFSKLLQFKVTFPYLN